MNVYLDFMKIPIRFMCVFGNTNTLLFHLKGQLLNISGFVALSKAFEKSQKTKQQKHSTDNLKDEQHVIEL
jgi:hypothetical protein